MKTAHILLRIASASITAIALGALAEPALPAGLGGGTAEPELPAGLGEEIGASSFDGKVSRLDLPFNLYGFWDSRAGSRLQTDVHGNSVILGEERIQIGADRQWSRGGFKLVSDFIYDYSHAAEGNIDLERGEGWIDLRQANITLTPHPEFDLKIGRQILTWGTGDLLFINDNFPKDWQSFFAGRDVEYLKAPSDAVKASFFSGAANLDLVYTPSFDPDRFITGNRISYYDPASGGRAGKQNQVEADIPNDYFEDDEIAARLYRNFQGTELAVYGYSGFWKSPGGQNMQGQAIFPRLNVYGASARSPVLGGIGNLEAGLYDSRDDRDGDDPMVNNSELRILAGYERDLQQLASDLTLGLQYYIEYMQDYDEYKSTLPVGMPARDEDRHVLTVRITKLLMQQNLELSFFAYYSPSDEDMYARPYAEYKINDNWQVHAGLNIFEGREDHTFFGQFEKNNNAYAGLRYSF
jgi:hypothetical protein